MFVFFFLYGCSPAETPITPSVLSIESKVTPSPFTATPIIENIAQPLTETSEIVLTAFAKNFPTPVLFPTSTSVTVSRPTYQEVKNADIPLITIGNKGADVFYISVPKDSIYLWQAGCFGKDIRDLQQNVSDMRVTFLINDQIVDKSKILEFDQAFGTNVVEHTWAILISGWQINTTTKFELRYSISQTLSENGLSNNKGDFYSIVYVNVP